MEEQRQLLGPVLLAIGICLLFRAYIQIRYNRKNEKYTTLLQSWMAPLAKTNKNKTETEKQDKKIRIPVCMLIDDGDWKFSGMLVFDEKKVNVVIDKDNYPTIELAKGFNFSPSASDTKNQPKSLSNITYPAYHYINSEILKFYNQNKKFCQKAVHDGYTLEAMALMPHTRSPLCNDSIVRLLYGSMFIYENTEEYMNLLPEERYAIDSDIKYIKDIETVDMRTIQMRIPEFGRPCFYPFPCLKSNSGASWSMSKNSQLSEDSCKKLANFTWTTIKHIKWVKSE